MKPRFIAGLAGVILLLFFVDRFLASLERREMTSEAKALYLTGQRFLASGEATAAIAPLTRSHMLVREDRKYQLALARALFGARRFKESELNLRNLLQSDSNDGAVNLAMARLQAELRNNPDAIAYYHRAIYGTWPAGDQPAAVRMELADFLARLEDRQQLLPELLLLQTELSSDAAMQKKLARLFLVAGSPVRAADMFRSMVRTDGDDADAWDGLAEAELASGDYSAAQASLRRALRRLPDDPTIEKRLEFVGALNALDPTPRRLTSKEKFARSQRVLGLIVEDLRQCAERKPAKKEEVLPLLTVAERRMKITNPVTNELAESVLEQAQALWQVRLQACTPAEMPPADALPLLMSKIGQ